MLEVEEHTDTQASDFQIIDDLSTFDIGDVINRFRFDNDTFEGDQVRNIFSNLN